MLCTHCGQHNQCTRCLAREARAVRQKSKGAIYIVNSRERKRRRVDEMQRNAATQERALLALFMEKVTQAFRQVISLQQFSHDGSIHPNDLFVMTQLNAMLCERPRLKCEPHCSLSRV